jgi:hypothetical protein
MKHVLLACPFSRQVWFGTLSKLSLTCSPPDSEPSLNDWWIATRQATPNLMRKGLATTLFHVWSYFCSTDVFVIFGYRLSDCWFLFGGTDRLNLCYLEVLASIVCKAVFSLLRFRFMDYSIPRIWALVGATSWFFRILDYIPNNTWNRCLLVYRETRESFSSVEGLH